MNQKQQYLILETESSIEYIMAGLHLFQNSEVPSQNFSFMQLLASGFERLLKCLICKKYYQSNNSYPTEREMKRFSHNINDLLSNILTNFHSNRHVESDIDFLQNHRLLQRLLSILSKFGYGGRYYNLTLITTNEPNNEIDNPLTDWDYFKSEIVSANPDINNISNDFSKEEEYNSLITMHIVIIIETFVRAICRQFNFENMDNSSKYILSSFFSYVNLADNKLGKSNY